MLKVSVVFTILLSTNITYTHAEIGINWGRRTSQTLLPSMVVDLLLQNEIRAIKLFNLNDELIKAFSGTNISVTLAMPRLDSITSLDLAKDWVLEKVAPFDNVNIRYVIVGSNAFGSARFNKIPFPEIVRALNLVQTALNYLGYGEKVKAVFTHSMSGTMILNSTKPSEASFVPDIMEHMLEVLKLTSDNNAPFIFDFYPLGYIQLYNLDMNFAFFDNKSTYSIIDTNGLQYNNALDAAYDAFVWALKKVGYGHLKVVCGQIGWPTDGAEGASVPTAERFLKGLLPKVMSKVGTPMRPGIQIDIFIQSLVDEKRNIALNTFARHWGVYRTNGEPKYKIDFSGKGRDVYPSKVRGLSLMPSRWCLFNGDNTNPTKVQKQFDFACQAADCTTLAQNGSCGALSPNEKVSYAFNGHFQANFQDEDACKFEELGTVVNTNPSKPNCVFAIEVVKGSKRVDPVSRWDNIGKGENPWAKKPTDKY